MALHWEAVAQYDAESVTYTTCAGVPASPFKPQRDGKLIGLRVIQNRSAATSLINHVQFRLNSRSFETPFIECGGQGSGLQTAPAIQPAPIDWQVSQSVKVGVDINIEGRNVTADTPVSVSTMLYGLFED
jgi:hypothetical protein